VVGARFPVSSYKQCFIGNYLPYEHTLNISNLTIPLPVKDIPKFESLDPTISVNVLSLDDKDLCIEYCSPKNIISICSYLAKVINNNNTYYQSIGMSSADGSPFFSRQLPMRLVTKLVTNQAFNGYAESNSFNFQHFNLNEIALYFDGQQQHAIRHILPHYESGLYIRAYDSMFAGTGKLCKDEGLYINRDNYTSGYALYALI